MVAHVYAAWLKKAAKNEVKIMTPKPTIATETDKFKLEISRLTLANTRLARDNKVIDEELKFAKAALIKIKAGYEARVKNTYGMDIQDVLGCSDLDLVKLVQGKTVEQLEQMYENFALATDAQKTPYDKRKVKTASIRPGATFAGPGTENLTVGSLFGKSREDILKMKGDI